MSQQENGLRKSKRTSAVKWKEGDTRALLRGPGYRAPEEIAANRKKAAEERKSKEQAKKAEAKKVARGLRRASKLEDALAKQREEAEDAFPRHRTDVETEGDETEGEETESDETESDETESDETESDESEGEDLEGDEAEVETPTQTASKQAAGPARRQARSKQGRYDVEIDTPTKPGRGLTSTRRMSLKRSYASIDLEAHSSEEGNRPEGGGTNTLQEASKPKPKPRTLLKKKNPEEGSASEDADPFDLRHRKRASQSVPPLNEPGQKEKDVLSTIDDDPTPQRKRTATKTQVDDGILELTSADDPDWQMSQGDNVEVEGDTTDLGTVEEDGILHASDTEESPRQKKKEKLSKPRTKKKSKGKRQGKLRDAILEGRQRKQPVIEPIQPAVNNLDLQRAKVSSDTEVWVRQSREAAVTQRRRRSREDTDDDAMAPAATSNASGNPKKKRRIKSGNTVGVIDDVGTLPSERSSTKASTSEKVSGNEPTCVQISSRYGGLEIEDDQEEYETIKQSPVKEKGVRISDSAMVKVESPTKIELPPRMSMWSVKHLPYGSKDRWRQFFITTYAVYIGTKHTPWDIRNKESIEAMQNCWDHIYGNELAEKYTIQGIHDVVFVVSDQRWKEFRNAIGTTAIQALDEYFNSIKAYTNKERHEEAKKLSSGNNAWLYGTVKRKPNGRIASLQEPFYGPLVLKTFGAFFKWTKSHDTTWPMIEGKSPIGALGLATAAVERAVMFWANISLSPETANQPAVKPFSKRKGKTGKSDFESQPDNPPGTDAGDNTEGAEGNHFGRIDEFNASGWNEPTKGWITGAAAKGFESMTVMQELIKMVTKASTRGSSSNRSRISADVIKVPAESRSMIAEGDITDSE